MKQFNNQGKRRMEAVFRQHSTWMYFAADPSVIITFTVSFRKYARLTSDEKPEPPKKVSHNLPNYHKN